MGGALGNAVTGMLKDDALLSILLGSASSPASPLSPVSVGSVGELR